MAVLRDGAGAAYRDVVPAVLALRAMEPYAAMARRGWYPEPYPIFWDESEIDDHIGILLEIHDAGEVIVDRTGALHAALARLERRIARRSPAPRCMTCAGARAIRAKVLLPCAGAFLPCAGASMTCPRARMTRAGACMTCPRACMTCAGACMTCRDACMTCRGACMTCAGACMTCPRARMTCRGARMTCRGARMTCAGARMTCAGAATVHPQRGYVSVLTRPAGVPLLAS